MDRMEQLVRDSLETRARDVGPTPVLWREVERRIARRRRGLIVTWSLAGAAAAVLGVLVVPGLLGGLTGPRTPEIVPTDEAPAPGGGIPTHAVVVDAAGAAEVLDLASGQRTPSGGGRPDVDGTPVDVVVRAGSAPDEVVYAMAVAGPRPGYVAAVTRGNVSDEVVFGARPAPGDPDLTVVGSSDGSHLAFLVPTEQDDGAVLHAYPFDTAYQEDRPGGQTQVVLEGGSRLLDWVGPTVEIGSASTLWVQRPDGRVVAVHVEQDGAGFVEVGSETMFEGRDVLDAASARFGNRVYVLEVRDGTPTLAWSTDGGVTDQTALDLADLLGVDASSDLWLDATQDAALVGDGDRAWLLVHDGAGGFAAPDELGSGIARAALLGPAAVEIEPDDPATDVAPPAPDDPAQTDGVLPELVVVADGRVLRVTDGDASQTLVELPTEGESTFQGVSVRPGSTLDDLTVATLTTAEGMWDLRWTRVVGGEVEVGFDAFEGAHGVTPGALASKPVWSADGTSLAWFERLDDGSARLRIVGWDDGPGTGDPATDNATFALDDAPPGAMLHLQTWTVESDLATGSAPLLAVLDEPDTRSYAIPLVRQADGAWALDGGVPSLIATAGPAGTGTIAALAARGNEVEWLVRLTEAGPELLRSPYGPDAAPAVMLPQELLPGEGLPTVWVRAVGDGALVGSPNTASAWYVGSGGPVRLPGEVTDADVLR